MPVYGTFTVKEKVAVKYKVIIMYFVEHAMQKQLCGIISLGPRFPYLMNVSLL